MRETKKNHERNSCNKNQSERREKAPRGAPTGRAADHPLPPPCIPTRAIMHLPSLPTSSIANFNGYSRFAKLPQLKNNVSKLVSKLYSASYLECWSSLAEDCEHIEAARRERELRAPLQCGAAGCRQKGVCFYFFGAEKNEHAPALHLLNMRHAATQTRPGVYRIHFHLRHLIVSRRSPCSRGCRDESESECMCGAGECLRRPPLTD